jgi:hypothetical protein
LPRTARALRGGGKAAAGVILFKTYEQRARVLRYSLTTAHRRATVPTDHFPVGSNE